MAVSRIILLIVAFLMAFSTCLSFADIHDKSVNGLANPKHKLPKFQPRPRVPMTCDRFPRVCRAKGSPGRDCCRRRCVNLKTDALNCGRCGRRCRFGSACCGGKCVGIMFDRRHCGGCKNKCKKGSFCRFGMCNYAH